LAISGKLCRQPDNLKEWRMRFVCHIAVIVLAGCASQPTPAPSAEPHRVKVDASNVVAVQRAGYKLVNKDGESLYCRTDTVTGSRLQTRTICLTERELDDQMNATKQGMERINQAAPPLPGH
jgi:hypothetical protein